MLTRIEQYKQVLKEPKKKTAFNTVSTDHVTVI